MQANGSSSDSQSPPGVVELREDVPLKAGSSFGGEGASRCCGSGPRFILACFAALSAGITLALLTQIYYGDYEVVPHGSVSSSAADCSQAGTDALKAGGKAVDAAAATAFCLAVLAPHRTSFDASGSLLYWEYRTKHAVPPIQAQWGGLDNPFFNMTNRPPRLLAAFASLHSRLGVLPWSKILQPAIDLARNGFPVSDGLSAAAAANNGVNVAPGTLRKAPLLADYLEKYQQNTSTELAMTWGSDRLVCSTAPYATTAGSWTVYTGGVGGPVAGEALAATLALPLSDPNKLAMAWGSDRLVRSTAPYATTAGSWTVYTGGIGGPVTGEALAATLALPLPDPDTAFQRVVTALQQSSLHGEWPPTGVATGLAVIDRFDTYVALVTGLTVPFGSGPPAAGGWLYDEPKSQLDLAPAMIVEQNVCGTRYVIGAESSSALAEAAAALLTDPTVGAKAVERPRVSVYAGGVLAIEADKDPPAGLPVTLPTPVVNATRPYPAVNVVLQNGDAMQSHADSRGGGLAYRF